MSPATALLTRTSKDNAALRTALEHLGLTVMEAPAIQILPPRDEERLRRHLERLAEYDWLLLTSASAVESCLVGPGAPSLPARVRIGVVGPATSAALRPAGRTPDFMPSDFTADSLASQLPNPAKRRILLLRAEVSNPALPRVLRKRGAIVDDVAAYRTIADPALATRIPNGDDGAPEWLVFASPSAVEAVHEVLAPRHPIRTRTRVACIGPVTARAARRLGFRVSVEADPHTAAGLARGIEEAMMRDA